MKLVALTRGAVAIVDDEDFALVSQYSWHAQISGTSSVYASTHLKGGERISMHRLIMEAPDDKHVDHITGLTLDNRRANLRLCTPAENARNRRPSGKCVAKKGPAATSEYKGVALYCYNGKRRKSSGWRAAISVDGVRKHLGVFKTEEEAARAYDIAARQVFGPFARLNFPDDQINPPNGSFFKPLEGSECETSSSEGGTMRSVA